MHYDVVKCTLYIAKPICLWLAVSFQNHNANELYKQIQTKNPNQKEIQKDRVLHLCGHVIFTFNYCRSDVQNGPMANLELIVVCISNLQQLSISLSC